MPDGGSPASDGDRPVRPEKVFLGVGESLRGGQFLPQKGPSSSQRGIIALKTAFAVQTAGSPLGDGAFADTAQGIVQLGPDAGVVAVTAG